MSRNRTHRRGANAIEFAFTFPVIIVMMFIVMDYGWYFSQQLAVNAAVRDATRIGATTHGDSDTAAEEAATEALLERLAAAGYTGEVTVDVRRVGEVGSESLHVGVALPYEPVSNLVPTPSTVKASQSMRLEQQQS